MSEAITLPPVFGEFQEPKTQAPTIPGYQIPDIEHVRKSTEIYGIAVVFCVTVYVLIRLIFPRWLMPRPVYEGRINPRGPVFGNHYWSRWYQWLRRPYVLSDVEFAKVTGLDALLVVRFIYLSLKILVASTLVALLVLLPCYTTQSRSESCRKVCSAIEQLGNGNSTDASTSTTGDYLGNSCVCKPIDQYSIANVDPNNQAPLWAPVAISGYLSLVILMLLRREYRAIAKLQHLIVQQHPPQHYTVLVRNLPKKLQGGKAEVEKYFENVFPNQVFRVDYHDFRNVELGRLRQLGKRRNKVLCLLEKAIAVEAQRGGSKVHHWRLACCEGGGRGTRCMSCCHRTESVKTYREQLKKLNNEFESLRNSVDLMEKYPLHRKYSLTETSLGVEETCGMVTSWRSSHASEPVAFVTFKSLTTAALVVQSQVASAPGLEISMAPEPSDVVWEALDAREAERVSRRLLSLVCFFVILLFWGLLTSFIGASTSTSVLARQFPAVNKALSTYPHLEYYLDQLAPLLLIFLVSIVNPILYLLAMLEGVISESEIERRTSKRFLIFLVVQVFVFYSVSGTVFKTLLEILQQPQHIMLTLATTIPKNAAFYIQFVVAKCFWTLMSDLFRIPELFFWFFREIMRGPSITTRERESSYLYCFHISYPSPRNISSTAPQLQLVLFIALTYATIQPLVLPAALVFFVVAAFVYPNVFLYSNRQHHKNTSALSWFPMFWTTVWAVLVSQLTLAGVLLAKGGYPQAMVVLLLALATFLGARQLDTFEGPRLLSTPIVVTTSADRQYPPDSTVTAKRAPVWQYGRLAHSGRGGTDWWAVNEDRGTLMGSGDNADASEMEQLRGPLSRSRRVVYDYTEPVLQEKLRVKADVRDDAREIQKSVSYGAV